VTTFRFGSATDVGLVRRSNQDNLLAVGTLFAVADGMGGHVGGEVASQVAIDALRDSFGDGSEPRSARDLVLAVQEANRAVFERAGADANLHGMGTTIAAAALVVEDDEQRIAVANVGDSRTYVFTTGELTQLSEDHSVAEELVRQGQLDPAEVNTHPQRHMLTRALGITPEVEVDLWEVLPYAGDRLLLCSDGLVREVTDDQISSVLRRLADPTQAAQELVSRARAAGGSDNISVVIIDVVDDDDQALEASRALGQRAVSSTASKPNASNVAGDAPDTFSAPAAVSTPHQLTPRPRRFTLRVALFGILLIVVAAGACGAIGLYARGSYFVTLGAAGSGPPGLLETPGAQPLIIDKGRPGGLLWFEPTLASTTQVLSTQVLPSRLADLRAGHIEPSLNDARSYIAKLLAEAVTAGTPAAIPATPSASPSTSTTVP